MGFTIDTLNSIRDNASEEYKNRIPVATQDNIAAIGHAFQNYTPLYNEFSQALICKIGKTMIEDKMFTNRLARFKSGTIMNAQDVEEIFVPMAKSEGAFDPDGPNPLGRRKTDPDKVIYHRKNREDVYCISLGDLDFRQVFNSEYSFETYVKAKLNSVYSGANKDEFLVMVNLLATYDGYAEYEVPVITEENAPQTAKKFVKTVRKALMDCTLDSSTEFNKAKVETWAEKKDMVLLVNKDVLTEVDVEVLAKEFHQDKTNLNVNTILPMPHFGELTDCYALMVDEHWFRVWDILSHMEPQRNAHGLFTNFFYHVQQIVSCSWFKTAIKFKAVPAAA